MAELHRRQIDGDDLVFGPGHRLAAGGFQNPLAERHDKAGFLGERDELNRRNTAALRVRPTHQRLEAQHLHGIAIGQRLVMQLQLASGNGMAQIALQQAPFLQPEIHLGFEEAKSAAAGFLGAVKCRVGGAHQFVATGAIAGEKGNADRGADDRLMAAEIEGLGQFLHQALGQNGRAVGVRHTHLDDRKFVAAEACHSIVGTEHAGQPLGNPTQQLIAGSVTVEIVHRLEAVEVETQDRDRAVATLGTRQRLGEAILEQGAVGKVGEGVVMRHIANALFRRLTFPDIAYGNNAGIAGIERHGAGQNLDRNFAAVCMAQAEFQRLLAAFRPPTFQNLSAPDRREARAQGRKTRRRYQIEDRSTDEGILRPADQRRHGDVGVEHHAVLVDDDALKRGVGQLPEARFAAAQTVCFQGTACGEVLVDDGAGKAQGKNQQGNRGNGDGDGVVGKTRLVEGDTGVGHDHHRRHGDEMHAADGKRQQAGRDEARL